MKVNNLLNSKAFIVVVLFANAVFMINLLGYTMYDDGWRHLAMATMSQDLQSWQKAYIHTLFREYDPWFMWHKFLGFVGEFSTHNNIYIAVNSFVYFFLSLWYFLIFKKYSKLTPSIVLFFAIFLPLLTIKYFNLRPEVLSGLFALYVLLFRSNVAIFVVSILYAPMYYVYWFFMGYIGYVKLVLGQFRGFFAIAFAGVIGSAFHLWYDLDGFVYITKLVLSNDSLRGSYSVGETYPFLIPLEVVNHFGSSVVMLSLMAFSILVYLVLKPKNELLKVIIFVLPMMIMQVRFFTLLYPLIVAFSVILFSTLLKEFVEGRIYEVVDNIKEFIDKRTLFGYLGTKSFYIIVVLFISIVFVKDIIAIKKGSNSITRQLQNFSFLKAEKYKNKKILFTSMNSDGYMGIYLNPTMSIYPSCALGWTDHKPTLHDISLRYISNDKISKEEFFLLFDEVDPDFFIITPRDSKTILNFSLEEMRAKNFVFKEVVNGYVVFEKIDKNKDGLSF